ncbi:MAG: class IV adenylate cyclase [Treponema sp.]|jgi:adenylate cyclase class 2|nr:class IV adenylate cyclase [Treponema sp.]
MGFEIEIKAWVDDPGRVKEIISQFADYGGEFRKEDGYWYRPGSPASDGRAGEGGIPVTGIRIRRERRTDPRGGISQTVLVTCKTKELREGLEVNDEREFAVSDGEAFAELLGRLGLEQGKTKTKHGWVWTWEGITAELTEVAGLGWFAEMEILADNRRPQTVKDARDRLFALLEKLGIGREKIEGRYYTELLNCNG